MLPVGMIGLCQMSNGICVGTKGDLELFAGITPSNLYQCRT